MVHIRGGGISTSIPPVYAGSTHHPTYQGIGFSGGGYPPEIPLASQISQLQAQISAYQSIVKNEQIPTQNLVAAIFAESCVKPTDMEPVPGYTYPPTLVSLGPVTHPVEVFHHQPGLGFTMRVAEPVASQPYSDDSHDFALYSCAGVQQLDMQRQFIPSQVYTPSYPYNIYRYPLMGTQHLTQQMNPSSRPKDQLSVDIRKEKTSEVGLSQQGFVKVS